MSDLRFDPLSRQWVSIAEKRRNRPVEFVPIEQARHQIICPFCAGNEDETPEPSVEFDRFLQTMEPSEVETNPWSVRVIPNKYPAFDGNGTEGPQGPYESRTSSGLQELVIPTPRHIVSISELEFGELKRAFQVAAGRIKHMESAGAAHAMLFMNCRMEAGASIEHIHFQLLGTPVASPKLTLRAQVNREHFERTGETLVQSLVNWESQEKTRVVNTTNNFVSYCPYASRLPLTIVIAPSVQPKSFGDSTEFFDELAELCQDAVSRIEGILERPSYNVLLHQAPFGEQHDHWFLEIFPRLSKIAGYEWGTDVWINPLSPESAARRLRMSE